MARIGCREKATTPDEMRSKPMTSDLSYIIIMKYVGDFLHCRISPAHQISGVSKGAMLIATDTLRYQQLKMCTVIQEMVE